MASPDPFDVLRLGDDVAISPRPEFALALRRRIESALGRTARGGPTMAGRKTSEVGYITIRVPDAERAQSFYGAVLGWEFTPGTVPHGYQVTNVDPLSGLSGGAERPEITLLFNVEDLDAAVARVRKRGGEADDPEDRPYGRIAACRDDQGMRFDLLESRPGG